MRHFVVHVERISRHTRETVNFWSICFQRKKAAILAIGLNGLSDSLVWQTLRAIRPGQQGTESREQRSAHHVTQTGRRQIADARSAASGSIRRLRGALGVHRTRVHVTCVVRFWWKLAS